MHAELAHRVEEERRQAVVGGQPVENQAREPHAVFGAFGVAAHPEEVLGGARRHRPSARRPRGHQLLGRDLGRQHREGLDRPVGAHPRVERRAAALHRDDLPVAAGDARERAGQHVPALLAGERIRVGDREDAQHRRARHELAAGPRGRLRERQVRLHGVGVGVALDALPPRVELVAARRRTHQRLERGPTDASRVRRLDDAEREVGHRVAPCRLLAAPPRRQVAEREVAAEQRARDRREEAVQRRRFEEAAAERVGDEHVARADRVDEARHADRGLGAQLDGIAEVVVQPSQDAVHALQAVHRLQVHARAAHREVGALDERQAEIPREVGVLEVGLVVRARRQQHDARSARLGIDARADAGVHARRQVVGERLLEHRRALALHERLEHVEEAPIAGRDVLHAQVGERLGKEPRDGQPVLERVAQAGRRLRALRDHAPRPVGPAAEVERDDVQAHVARHVHAGHRPEVAGVPLDQRLRHEAAFDQRARAVDVGGDRVEQRGALRDAGLDAAPLRVVDDEGQQVERPRARRTGVRVHRVRHPVLLDLPRDERQPAVQVAEAGGAEQLEEPVPRRAQRAMAVAQLVEVAVARGQRKPLRDVGRARFEVGGEEGFGHDDVSSVAAGPASTDIPGSAWTPSTPSARACARS